MQKNSKFHRMAFVINGIVFMLGSMVFMEDNKPFFGIVLLLAGLVNLAGLIPRLRNVTGFWVQIMNIIVAIITAWDYFDSGKKYIQYAWILVAAFSSFLFIQQYRNKL